MIVLLAGVFFHQAMIMTKVLVFFDLVFISYHLPSPKVRVAFLGWILQCIGNSCHMRSVNYVKLGFINLPFLNSFCYIPYWMKGM